MRHPARPPFREPHRSGLPLWSIGLLLCLVPSVVFAQSVCLPSPRLLTITPMGGQVGTQVEVALTGEHVDGAHELRFSHPGITAVPAVDDEGQPKLGRFLVTIEDSCPLGVHEARVRSRLGISSPRAFNVGSLPEITRTSANTTLMTAMALPLETVCNAHTTLRAVDHYRFEANTGQTVYVSCDATGIDSKLVPVLIVADENGQDLIVERQGRVIAFDVPQTGKYVIKVHDLTYRGGNTHFYRLTAATQKPSTSDWPLATRDVKTHSWPPPAGLPAERLSETEPNNTNADAELVTLPIDIAGRFYPAADIDSFQFDAKRGEEWWIEVASDRLGHATDPAVVVQRVMQTDDGQEELIDVVELNDIDSPVKVSTNHYSYDGPPYNAGSTDVLGKLSIPEDGRYRLQVFDLFGGTRSEPSHSYRLIVRKPQPDFSVVGWALHMNLRNGDRNALSKPLALRAGAVIPIEVVVVRRDGFEGEIDLLMESLPEGVTATGLTIPATQTRGHVLLSAAEDAPEGISDLKFLARATIEGKTITRPAAYATMTWPVKNAWSEIPDPRLVMSVPVSVSRSELAPLSIAATEPVFEVTEGETLTIPLDHRVRSEFSGATLSLRTFGYGFTRNPTFEVKIDGTDSQAVIDLKRTKTPPGEYTIAFYGSAVAKYRNNVPALVAAEAEVKRLTAEAERLGEQLASLEKVEVADQNAKNNNPEVVRQKKAAIDKQLAQAKKVVAARTRQAQPKDIVDIVATAPIRVRVLPKDSSAQPEVTK